MYIAPFERRWARAIFRSLYPSGAHPRVSVGLSESDADRVLDEALLHWPLPGLLALRAGLWAVALAPLFVIGRLRTFTGLRDEERTRVLERLYESDVYLARNFVVLLKTLAGIHYMGSPAIRGLVAPRGAPPPVLLDDLVRTKKSRVDVDTAPSHSSEGATP